MVLMGLQAFSSFIFRRFERREQHRNSGGFVRRHNDDRLWDTLLNSTSIFNQVVGRLLLSQRDDYAEEPLGIYCTATASCDEFNVGRTATKFAPRLLSDDRRVEVCSKLQEAIFSNRKWKLSNNRHVLSNGKLMLMILFDVRGIVHKKFVWQINYPIFPLLARSCTV